MAQDPFRGVWYCCGTANTYPGNQYVYSGPMATYCAWHRPMAIYAAEVNKTFFVFGNASNSPAISFYDHERGVFAPPVVLGRNPDMDAHRNPTLHIDSEGYVYVFYGAHGSITHVIKSQSPYDIARWIPKPDINDKKNTYPQPWALRAGEIFVSFRQSPGWCYRKSSDGADSWEEPINLIRFRDASIYAVTIAESGAYPRTVHIAWSRLGGGTPEEIRSKHLWARRYNVYYARSNDGGMTWRKSDETEYALPISDENAEMLYDSGQHGVWLKDIQLDAAGNPYILFIDADATTYESAWKLARRTGNEWEISDITVSDHMYDDGALVILSGTDFRIYAPTTPSQPHEDGGEIEEWRSTDKGRTWRNTRHVTAASVFSHNNVKTVFNHQKSDGSLRVMWSYGDSTFPPSTRDVLLYHYGEALPERRQIEASRADASSISPEQRKG